MTILLNNVSADVSDPPAADIFTSRGGPAVVNVRGDAFGGGTVAIQTRTTEDQNLRWETLNNGSFTANGTVKIDFLPNTMQVRALLSGSTGANDVFANIVQ